MAYQTPVRLTPAVDRFFKAQARDQTGQAKAWLSDAAAALKTKRGRAWLLSEPERNALLRATITPTVLEGSEKTNIIPQEASVELDIRLLPDEDTVAFRRTLERLIADPKIEIESIGDMAPPYSAPLDTEMFRALERVAGRLLPGVPVATPMSAGATDRPYWSVARADLLWDRSVPGGAGGEPLLGARQRRAAVAGEHRVRAEVLRGDGAGDGGAAGREGRRGGSWECPAISRSRIVGHGAADTVETVLAGRLARDLTHPLKCDLAILPEDGPDAIHQECRNPVTKARSGLDQHRPGPEVMLLEEHPPDGGR